MEAKPDAVIESLAVAPVPSIKATASVDPPTPTLIVPITKYW
jgi:hypothetical protein